MPRIPGVGTFYTCMSISDLLDEHKRYAKKGCVSFFCTHLCCSTDGGRRTSEKRFAPGVARARTTREWLLEGLSRRSAGSRNRWVRQPMHPYCPHDEQPQGSLLPLLGFRLPTGGAQHLPMSHRCCPGLLPLSIAHGVAQHEHGGDVLPTEAACQRL